MDSTPAWISAAPGGLLVWPLVVEPTGGASKLATSRNGGQSVQCTIRTADHTCWTIRGVDNPQVGKTTIHREYDLWGETGAEPASYFMGHILQYIYY